MMVLMQITYATATTGFAILQASLYTYVPSKSVACAFFRGLVLALIDFRCDRFLHDSGKIKTRLCHCVNRVCTMQMQLYYEWHRGVSFELDSIELGVVLDEIELGVVLDEIELGVVLDERSLFCFFLA
jgi:hypothetical protein